MVQKATECSKGASEQLEVAFQSGPGNALVAPMPLLLVCSRTSQYLGDVNSQFFDGKDLQQKGKCCFYYPLSMTEAPISI